MPAFTAHNIELPDGRQTNPEFGLIEHSGVCQATLRSLRSLFGPDEIASASVADLGCLEGGYTLAFARAGFHATGIEVRDQNIECCRYIQSQVGLPNLAFIQDDVRNIAAYGPFDAVFCCGLLYHLDRPGEYIQALGRQTRRVLILQTHYASERVPEAHAPSLSELVWHEGNLGRWYKEFEEGVSEKDVEDNLWASWGNRTSFWIEKRYLVRSLLSAGFDCVYEQFDYFDPITETYWEDQTRSMFVAVKLRDTFT
jgi:hypothetical protein